jgi:hypothetical protein
MGARRDVENSWKKGVDALAARIVEQIPALVAH